MKIGVVGVGYVGSAVVKMFEKRYEVFKYDPALSDSATKEEINLCDLAVVCVPTEMDKTGEFPFRCDTKIVEETIDWLETPVIMIKSTVEPGTTDRLKEKTGKRIVMSPEYIGEGKYYVPAELDFTTNMEVTPFWILGGDEKDTNYIIDILVPILGPVKTYYSTTAIEAELVKYFENYFLGLKVVFANEMKEIVENLGGNYYKIREGWVLDPRVSKFHSLVFPGKEGFSGKCLPKDLNALYRACKDKGYEPTLLKSVLETNNKIRERHNLPLDY